ncbi:MAG: ribonuclease III [Clostridia bacterium]|nr:ribonuclease III [Clostridia bacterium]
MTDRLSSQVISPERARGLDPLVLAYVGDGVETLWVRTHFALEAPTDSAGKLHRKTVGVVSAEAQAKGADAILDLLSEEERDVYRQARNHKTKSGAKNATVGDYHKATGLEAVWGYLYLTGRQERLDELLALATGLTEGKV